jgi:hypothetical protein
LDSMSELAFEERSGGRGGANSSFTNHWE